MNLKTFFSMLVWLLRLITNYLNAVRKKVNDDKDLILDLQHKFNNQRNNNRPWNNWDHNRQSTAYGQHNKEMLGYYLKDSNPGRSRYNITIAKSLENLRNNSTRYYKFNALNLSALHPLHAIKN
ncbi:hypothetical protein RB213_005037 [Colletotrichum asianum]